MNIRPLHDRVLVRKLAEAEKTKSGMIVLPQTSQQGSQLGLVTAVGEGRSFDGPGEVFELKVVTYNAIVGQETPDQKARREAIEQGAEKIHVYERQRPVVKVGQLVLFGKFSGTEVEVEGDTVFILREDEVVAVVEDPPQELLDRAQKKAVAPN